MTDKELASAEDFEAWCQEQRDRFPNMNQFIVSPHGIFSDRQRRLLKEMASLDEYEDLFERATLYENDNW